MTQSPGSPAEAAEPQPHVPQAPAAPAAPVRRPWWWRLLKAVALCLLALVLVGMTFWATLAIDLADLSTRSPRHVRAGLFAVVAVAVLLFVRPRRYGLLAFLAMFCLVLLWYFSLTPLNDRAWAAEWARVPTVEIDGDRLTVRNVRNFDYRSETDYTPRWEDRTYDLAKLRGLDMMMVYWGSKSIGHGIISFAFDGGEYLSVSIETRREKHEAYSAVQGFFRQYELAFVFADERDAVRLRTNYRNEDVHLYQTNITPDRARAVLLAYAARANELARQPEFYNALTSNCVTNIVYISRAINPSARLTWETLLSGHAARQAYRNGRLDTRLPFEELEARSRVNEIAKRADADPDFSRTIRRDLPNPRERP